jgi:general secretion pathway protein G
MRTSEVKTTPRSKRHSQRHGFTLVELVVVVLVLGIIASVAAPKMFDTAGDARTNSTVQSLAVLRDGVELYKAKNGSYPGDAGTELDFKSDMEEVLAGAFPKNQITAAANDATVKVEDSASAITASGAQDWKYNKQTGEFIINTTGFDDL